MVRRAVVLTGSAILGLALAPVAVQGGMGAGPQPRSFVGRPEFRQNSAFGGPGGFPFMPRLDRRVPRIIDRRLNRPIFFPVFPVTSFWYAPSVPYAPPSDVPPSITSVAPVTYVSPTVYVSLPIVAPAPAPAPIAGVAALPSTPSVVEYPTGRYELRGDGAGTPYTWVWIPNPPPAPPTAAPEVPASTSSPLASSQVYRWTDDQGTEFWTNRLEKVPEPYRSRIGDRAQLAAQQ
jgi:hypothetical protein